MQEDSFEKSIEDIKELYGDMESIIKMNPQLYIMPKELYNQIMKKITHLGRELDRARKSRDNWKDKLKKLKESK
jgi:hypothetical protein